MSRQIYVSPERMAVQKLSEYPLLQNDGNFDSKRFQEIETEFKALDLDNNGSLSKTEIHLHLQKKGCDEELIQEIFNDLNTDLDQKISKDEFCHGYFRKEGNIKNEIKEKEQKIILFRSQLESIKKVSKEHNNPQIIVTLQSGCLSNYFKMLDDISKASRQVEAIISCNDSITTIQQISKPSLNCEFPVWGDQFKFELDYIQTTDIQLELIEINKLEKRSIGIVKIQKFLNQDFTQIEKLTFENSGEIMIQIQFISDSISYMEAQSLDLEKKIKTEFDNAKKLKKKLFFMQQLYSQNNQNQWLTINNSNKEQLNFNPFNSLQQYNLSNKNKENNILLSQINQQNEIQQSQQSQSIPIIKIQPQLNLEQAEQLSKNQNYDITKAESVHLNYIVQEDFSDAFNIFRHSISEPEDIIIDVDLANNQERLKILAILMLCLLLNFAFGKTDYLGIIIITLTLPYQKKKWNVQQIKFFSILMLFSIVNDVFWLVKFSSCFNNSQQCNEEYGISIFSYFLSIINTFGKLITLYKIRSYN